jgi:hypothetical protein
MRRRHLHGGFAMHFAAFFPARPLPTLVLSGLCIAWSAGTAAQTCASPEVIQSVQSVSGTTCGAESDPIDLCNGAMQTVASSHVYAFTLGTGATGSFQLVDLESSELIMVLTGPGCDSGSCRVGDAASGISVEGLPQGDYDLVITANPALATSNDCGAFTLGLTGDFGTRDEIFRDGFD